MPTPVEILIRGRNTAGPAFTQLQQQLSATDRAASLAAGGLNAMIGVFAGGAALMAIGSAVRELQTLGIQSANTEQAFRSMAGAAGESADEMLGKLRAASRGMVTDVDLMMNANRAMMLGVTTNADEMARLLEVAATRGRALGRSTADAFTDIVTGIGRMSPLILDNLGIVTGGEKAFDAYAAKLGKTADELTDVERKQMLVNKVLEGTAPMAAAAADKVGGLGVALDNYKAALGRLLASYGDLTGLTGALADLADKTKTAALAASTLDATGLNAFQQNIAWLKDKAGLALSPMERLAVETIKIAEASKSGAMESGKAAAAIEALGRAYLHGATYAGVMVRVMDEYNAVARETGSISVAPVQTAFPRLGDAAGSLSDNLRELPPQVKEIETTMRTGVGAASAYNAELENLKSTIEGLINSAVSGTKGLVDFSAATVGGFDPNGPARDFGRMWDVAVNGFQSQWLDELRAQGLIPDDVLAEGEAALKQFAESKARAFQAGTDLGMLDTGAIVAQVQQQLAANAEMERIKGEVLAALTGQGVNKADAQKALAQVMGGSGAGVDVGMDIASGIPQGLNNAGTTIAATLKQQLADASDRILEAGRIIGRGLGDGLLQVFKENVPAELVSILADLVAPEVLKRLTTTKTTTGARP